MPPPTPTVPVMPAPCTSMAVAPSRLAPRTSTSTVLPAWPPIGKKVLIAGVAALRGRPDEARAVLKELEERQRIRYVSPVALAMIP